jgi:plasmid stability protein
MNFIQHRPDLIDVAMPLVRLLNAGNLSWQNRVAISHAIRECHRHWKSMEDEKRDIEQRSAQGQQESRRDGE